MQVTVRVTQGLQYFTPFSVSGEHNNVFAFNKNKKTAPGNGAYRVAKTTVGEDNRPTLTLVEKTTPNPAFMAEPERRTEVKLTSKLAMAKKRHLDATATTASSSERTQIRLPDDEISIKRYTRYRGGSFRNVGRKPRYQSTNSSSIKQFMFDEKDELDSYYLFDQSVAGLEALVFV